MFSGGYMPYLMLIVFLQLRLFLRFCAFASITRQVLGEDPTPILLVALEEDCPGIALYDYEDQNNDGSERVIELRLA